MLFTIDKAKKIIEKEIEKHTFGEHPNELYEPIRYIMSIGGKRMRPILMILSYRLFNEDLKKCIKPAIAAEAFHNFTLMHDDIMDDAPLRRGKPTVHEKWDVNTAILSGDVMLVKTYELLLTVEKKYLHDFLHLFNTMAARVCEGQQMDMNFEKREDVTLDEYMEMIKRKTAELLAFCMEAGALLAGADSKNRQLLKDCGYHAGIAFQLMDDLLDLYGDAHIFGKTVGGDIVANKKTYLLLTALSRAKENDKEKLKQLLSLDGIYAEEKIKEVKKIFDKLEVRTITELKINEYFEKAFQCLRKTEASMIHKNQLKKYLETLSNRNQ